MKRLAMGTVLAVTACCFGTTLWGQQHRPLFQAVYTGNSTVLARLAAVPGALIATNRSGLTPLMAAAAFGRTAQVELLLKLGASVDAAVASGDQQGKTALFFAVSGGHLHTAVRLLAAGASASTRTPQGHDPLIYASAAGSPALVRLLLGAGADAGRVDGTGLAPLVYAAAWDNKAVCNLLLEHGVPVPDRLASAGRLGGLIAAYLHGVADAGYSAVFRALDRGITARAALLDGTNRRPAVVTAAARGHNRIVWQLLAAGAGSAVRDSRQQTPLLAAVSNGYGITGHLLLEAGADPNAADSSGMTALHYAAAGGQRDMVYYLLRAGADPARTNAAGETPLAMAVARRQLETARVLNNWKPPGTPEKRPAG